jgi:magnesium chelatase subunit D
VFPFSAIAGQETLKQALLLNAVEPSIGGALIRGERGTAKSTAVRALASLLPPVPVVAGCPYRCAPESPPGACPWCAERLAAGEQRVREVRPVPLVELPVAATEDRVAGAFDLQTAIQRGERRFEPGLLAAANRAILYVDEVNLLPDHLVDLVLDAAAGGTHRVEREGISVSHPAHFVLVGTMNPEEGDLRPQLLDRFGLAADVTSPRDPELRATIVRRRIAFDADPAAFSAAWAAEEQRLGERIAAARSRLPAVQVDDPLLDLIARICVAYEVDGLRADIVIYKAAAALAAYDGRDAATVADVRAAAALALPHRRRRDPFEESGFDPQPLDRLTKELEGASPLQLGEPAEGGDVAQPPPAETPIQPVVPSGALPPLPPPRRPRASSPFQRGRQAGTISAPPSLREVPASSISFAATIRAAAPYQHARRQDPAPHAPAIHLTPSDLRLHLRRERPKRLLLFVLDASGSMAAQQRMALAKGTVQALLLDAYRRRDQVGLIAFAGSGARLILPPTSSVDLAQRRLSRLTVGGRTPLAPGLDLAHQTVLRQVGSSYGEPTLELAPLLVLLTDGRASAAPGGLDPWGAALAAARRVRRAGIASAVVDADGPGFHLGLSQSLAGALGAPLLRPGPGLSTRDAAPALAGHIRNLASTLPQAPTAPRWV